MKPAAKRRWKPAKGVTWRSKLERAHPSHGKVVRVPASMRRPGGPGTLLIPRPLDVDAAVRSIRPGRVMTVGALRARLARGSGADAACPLTTGLFLRIVAEAAEEGRRDGRARITPWWRVVRDNGAVIEKFPGGAAGHARRLRAEGHRLAAPGRGGAPRIVGRRG